MRLRKLTRKSIIGFGRYEILTIGEILIMHKDAYLRWVYYNASHINFFNDILTEIGIHEKIRIDKPGTNPDLREKCHNENLWEFPEMSDIEKKERMGHAQMRRKCNRLTREVTLSNELCKSNNLRRNRSGY